MKNTESGISVDVSNISEDDPGDSTTVKVEVKKWLVKSGSSILTYEEHPLDFDESRKLFFSGLSAVSFTGFLGVLLIWTYPTQRTDAGFIDYTWNSSSNLHGALMTTFLVFTHGYAVLVYRIFPENRKALVKVVHVGLHCVNMTAGIIAFVSIYQARSKKNLYHLGTPHSCMGALVLLLYYGQFLGGFIAYFMPIHIQHQAKPLHKYVGVVGFIIAAVVASMGLMSWTEHIATKMSYESPKITQNFAALFIILYACGVVLLVTEYNFRRRHHPLPMPI